MDRIQYVSFVMGTLLGLLFVGSHTPKVAQASADGLEAVVLLL